MIWEGVSRRLITSARRAKHKYDGFVRFEQESTRADNISCCGRNCYTCQHFPHDCVGCNEIGGRVFWLEFVDEVICPIFNCCRNKLNLDDCGLCAKSPCFRYESDPAAAVNDEIEAEERVCLQIEIG